MTPRIELDESTPKSLVVFTPGTPPPRPSSRQLLNADWEDSAAEPLMLYVAEEPRVGLEFSYHGLNWRIVDYRDGWVADLVVD